MEVTKTPGKNGSELIPSWFGKVPNNILRVGIITRLVSLGWVTGQNVIRFSEYQIILVFPRFCRRQNQDEMKRHFIFASDSLLKLQLWGFMVLKKRCFLSRVFIYGEKSLAGLSR